VVNARYEEKEAQSQDSYDQTWQDMKEGPSEQAGQKADESSNYGE